MFLVSNSFFDLRARTVWVTRWRSSLERVASGKCFKVKVKSLYCGHSIRKHWFLYLFCSFVPNDCPSLHVTCPSVDVIPVEQWYEKETGSYMKLLTYHVMISEKKTSLLSLTDSYFGSLCHPVLKRSSDSTADVSYTPKHHRWDFRWTVPLNLSLRGATSFRDITTRLKPESGVQSNIWTERQRCNLRVFNEVIELLVESFLKAD